MAKEYQFNWRPKIPDQLIQGDVFDRYDDESCTLDLSCSVRFEDMGFYIVFEPKGKDALVLDLVTVWEVRPSGTLKDARILYDLEQRGIKESVEERTVWFTYGQDLVNVNNLYLIAKSAQVAKEWRHKHIRVIRCFNSYRLVGNFYRCRRQKTEERFLLRNIIKTFASGKPERMIHKCLTDLGLAGDRFLVTRRVMRGRLSRGVRALYTCGTARKHKKKEREELDAHLFTFDKFLRLYHKVCPRTDIQELFVKLSGQKEYLTQQRDPRLNEILFPFFDNDRVQQLIAKYETDESYVAQGKMSGDSFMRFLMSDENQPVFLDRIVQYQDMDQPLCHYYINSSHNTYLTGRQYGGKSSTEMYRQALLSGCRCIEIDLWDGTGENRGFPIVTHGKAMCTDVFFKDVLYQIKETAFVRTDFPLILSFENHCSKSNQLKIAKYCMEIFGDMLLTKPLDDYPLEPGVPLPSPNRLRNKILIKNKRLKPELEKQQMEQFLREGRLDEEEDMEPEVIGEDAVLPHYECELTDEEGDHTMHGSASMSPATRSTTATPLPHEPSPLAAITNAYCGRLTPSSSRSFASISGPSGVISSRQSSPRNSIDSRSLLLAAFGGDVRRLRGSQKSQPTTSIEPLNMGGGIERFDRSNSSRSVGGSRSPRFPFRHMTSSVKSSTNSPPATGRGSGSGPASGNTSNTPGTPTAGDQRAHPEQDGSTPVPAVLPPPVPPTSISNNDLQVPALVTGDIKPLDEAHPELKQTNFMSKLKPLGFTTKKPQQPQTQQQQTPPPGQFSDMYLDVAPQSTGSSSSSKTLTDEEEQRVLAEYRYTGGTVYVHPLLSALINYTHPVKFSGFDVAENNNLHFHMSSFSESTGLGYLKQYAPEFVNYNKRQLSRIYPKGARVDSSNFLPQIFWNAGCQLVSLNFQTPDVCMQLNQGKFDYNGSCGYLLKPEFMRRLDKSFDPFSESPVDGVIAAHCSVKVISGQFLCERKVGTYVEVEMYGLPTDTIRKEHRTKTIPGNGLNPVYNEDPFVFRKVVLPELAVLRFVVYDESGKQLGQRILPLDGLQSGTLCADVSAIISNLIAGYRHISLRTESGMQISLATLFVQLMLKTYVPDELSGLVDALADPRAYLSAQEKRKYALHNMGVEDNEIVEVAPTINGNGKTRSEPQKKPDLKKLNGVMQNSALNEAKDNVPSPSTANPSGQQLRSMGEPTSENKYKSEPINLNDLRKDKSFQKLAKKMKKELEEMRRRHQKQRDSIQKQQQTNVEKLMCNSQKMAKKRQNSTNTNSSRHSSISAKGSGPDPVQQSPIQADQKMRSLVSNQTDEWSSLVKKQTQEDFEQRKTHIKEEYELLKKLLVDTQKQQMAHLKMKFEAESKELKQNQTKKSMDDSKGIQQDKNIKTKAEQERRIRELKEKNVKLFMEERRRLGMKQRRHEEQLEKKHAEQTEALDKEAAKNLELEVMNNQELQLAARPEAVV
ncbi:Phosphoinositide phospholipase C [Aphelenchoides bicaudatus]|nr:Phosphoinositide phospholipase C [Aphelenchoides bicaudatus]